jgi:hypothetical protein
VSLPDPAVLPILERDFVLAWRNIKTEDYVGNSMGYKRDQSCVGTTNGAGGRNVQIFILSPDHVVLHALPGFWHPDDLAHELELAKVAWRLWRDESRSDADKRTMYSRIVLADLRFQDPGTYARSDWQSFDKSYQSGKIDRDTFERNDLGNVKRTESGAPILKPLNVLAHQRMAARAFLPFDEFDVDAFVEYGQRYYDNNRDRGRPLK